MLSICDLGTSRYLWYRNLVDAGFEPLKASAAVDVLLGRDDELPGEEVPLDDQADEFEPSEEDWRDYHSYCRSVEQRLLEARMASDWDDEQERRYRYTDSDAASAGVAVG